MRPHIVPNSHTLDQVCETKIVVRDEHFAACLIECGPHLPKVIDLISTSPTVPSYEHGIRAYYDSIYGWYCSHFLYMGEGTWQKYLKDYCRWVEYTE